MAVVNMANNLKELFPEYVVLLKIGTFYECYNDDANIISYLFQYKIKILSSGDKNCGFPLVSYNRVISNLESRNINYISIDKNHNYISLLSCFSCCVNFKSLLHSLVP